jgi:hypothetical protein
MARDFQNVQVYIYGYQDKFKALPGDDHSADTHVTGTNAGTGTQNGVIQGTWNTTTNTDESCVFWEHVRRAGLAPGSTAIDCAANNTYQPRNADGGLVGVQSASTLATITGMTGAYAICSDAILGKFAIQLDTTLDDGETSTGSVRAITSGTAGAGMTSANVNLAPSATYTVCMTI